MKLIIFILLCFNTLHALETIRFDEDGRTWVFTGKAQTGESTFIPEGDSDQNWKEVFVIHHTVQSKIPLETYYQNFMSALNSKNAGLFNSKILKSDDSSILFEWWTDSDIPNAQHGWVKVFFTEEGLGFMRYTTKNVDLIDKIKPIWETILSTYDVALIPDKINVRINWNQDPKKWERDESQGIERYRLKEENEDLTEVVTVDRVGDIQETLRDYYQAEVEELRARYSNINSRIVFDTGTRILYEWWYNDGKRTVHEWAFISKENFKAAVIVKHYIASDKNFEGRKQIWETILKNVKVDASYHYQPIKSPNWVGPSKFSDDKRLLKEDYESPSKSQK